MAAPEGGAEGCSHRCVKVRLQDGRDQARGEQWACKATELKVSLQIELFSPKRDVP